MRQYDDEGVGAVLASSYAETLRGWDMPVARAVVAKKYGVGCFLLLLLLLLLRLFLLQFLRVQLTPAHSEPFLGAVWTCCTTKAAGDCDTSRLQCSSLRSKYDIRRLAGAKHSPSAP